MRIDPDILQAAVEMSDRRFAPSIAQARIYLDAYVGPRYQLTGDLDDMDTRPAPYIKTVVDAFYAFLSINPRAWIQPTGPDATAWYAARTKARMDWDLYKGKVQRAFNWVMFDAFFGNAVLKTSNRTYTTLADARTKGTVKYEWICRDDFICDPVALTVDGADWIGNRYRPTVEEAGKLLNLPESRMDDLWELQHGFREEMRKKRLDQADDNLDYTKLLDRRVELIDIHHRTKGLIYTIPGNIKQADAYVLQERPYVGPDEGMYDMLHLSPMGGALMSGPLVGSIIDMHLLLNLLAIKMGLRAAGQKDVMVGDLADKTFKETMLRAADGDFLPVIGGMPKAGVLKTGGVTPEAYQAFAWVADQLDYHAKSPNIIGGMSTDEKTLGQSELRASGAQGVLDQSRRSMREFGASVLDKARWYMWEDELYSGRHTVPSGMPGFADETFVWPANQGPESRMGSLDDYRCEIEVYDNPYMSKAQRAEAQKEWFGMVAAMGIVKPEFLIEIGKNMGIEDAARWVNAVPALEQQGAGMSTQNINVSGAPAGSPGGGRGQMPAMAPTQPGQGGMSVQEAG